ncbi:MAG: pcaG [Ilumatobacteraceae bacterium]|nr:pcaG [Ilumatobacteraceae bacterium]
MTAQQQGITPSQTAGPYFTMVLGQEGQNIVAGPGVPGTRIRVQGRVFDGDRNPIDDALIDVWQANAAGRYRHPLDDRDDLPLDETFTGFGSVATAYQSGLWSFDTIKPGPVPDPNGGIQAPHLNLIVQARGMLMPSFTRLYFPEDADEQSRDMVLSAVPAHRRSTLIASAVTQDTGAPGTPADVAVYTMDIKFQGDDETVFFDL